MLLMECFGRSNAELRGMYRERRERDEKEERKRREREEIFHLSSRYEIIDLILLVHFLP